MTEASENDYVVRVRAQVMCRDEGTGGWLALGGGGLAEVMVGRRPHLAASTDTPKSDPSPPPVCASSSPPSSPAPSRPPSAPQPRPLYDYYISGHRISDNTTVLECTIGKDFQYNKVMPTFHHWVTEHKRFGLTFQTAADARAFDKGVRTAVDDILQGLGGSWPLQTYKQLYPGPREDDEEQPIFECLNLPSESRSSSENSTASRAKRTQPELTQTPILSAITLPHAHAVADPGLKYDLYDENKIESVDTSCPYVHLSAVHEYSYATCRTRDAERGERGEPLTTQPRQCGRKCQAPPPLPDKKLTEQIQGRLRCKHCHELYLERANRAGSCYYAPDAFRSCVDYVSCIRCAQGTLYHCSSDPDIDCTHPCRCSYPRWGCIKRWICLSVLSVLAPCLCCYLPLRCVYHTARACRLAGGRHVPISVSAPKDY